MSQDVWSSINPASTSGTQLATLLDAFKNAVMSGLSGTARPDQTTAGGTWIDTTNQGSPNFYWSLKVYTGSVDIELLRINLATNKPSIIGSDSTFEISRISADDVGGILKIIKQRIASNGMVNQGDSIGSIQFIGRGSDSSNPVVAYIEVEASDEFNGTKSGGDMVFYTTPSLGTAAAEIARIKDGKLGVGTPAPAVTIHALGTGIRSEKNADDATGAVISTSKSRIAGTKASQNNDVLSDYEIYTTDDASAKVLSARIRASATQAHTASARGTSLAIQTSDTGATTPTTKMTIGDKVEAVATLRQNASELVSQDIATSATIAALSAAKAIVEFTGSTITSIQGMNSAHASKIVTLHNRSSAYVNVLHENGTASAADRFKLPFGTLIAIPPEGAAEFFYCVTDTRWKLKGLAVGAGGAGGGSGMEIYLPDTNAAEEAVLANGMRLLDFAETDEQEVIVHLPVPLGYVAGTQLKLQSGKFFSAITTGNVLFRATAYLFKAGVDGTSTPTGYASTNAQVAVDGTTNEIVEIGDVDITSSTGTINAVAVAGGDSILVRIKRLTSSETSGAAGTARLLRHSFQPKFSA